MTSIFSSPSPHSSGRKRPFENTSPSHPFGAPLASSAGLKRRRDTDEDMWVSPYSSKRVCAAEENRSNGSLFASQADREIRAMKLEWEEISAQREAELQSLREENRSMQTKLQQSAADGARIIEENRILKRAVAIMENRQRDLMSQHEQYEGTMAAAQEHILMLERSNAQLRSLVQSQTYSNNSGFGNHRPPPDVY